ncbi:MAG: hypothetical protein IPO95_04755 [Rhodanobacteraceae bacterium]|nr:hypothetical protein [Rhodanobacteraceae bacterium]
MSLASLREAARLIRHHHELYDGGGFPDGLRGEAIPLGARILCVVNEYDMLIHGKSFLEVYTGAQARQYLSDHRGSRYDPVILDKFLEFIAGEAWPIAEKELVCEPGQLRSGMRLARDLVTKSGIVLLPRGHVLDQPVIDRIAELSRDTGAHIRICVLSD